MNRRIAVVGLFAALAQTVKSDEADQNSKTQGLINGRYWNEMLWRERMLYVLGAVNGASEVRKLAFTTFMPATGQSKQFDRGVEFAFVPNRVPVGDLVEKITLIYSDPANLVLPIIEVYSLATMASNGTTPDDLARLIENVRAEYLQR
jgi:hypothetical protein